MFEVLAEPHRRRILDLLREREQAVGDLVSALGISQPGVSKHLRVLREAGLVEARIDAQRRLYRLRTSRSASSTSGWRPTGPPGPGAWMPWKRTSTTWKTEEASCG